MPNADPRACSNAARDLSASSATAEISLPQDRVSECADSQPQEIHVWAAEDWLALETPRRRQLTFWWF
jgi:hypothetical protein